MVAHPPLLRIALKTLWCLGVQADLSYHMPVDAPYHRYGVINRLKIFDQGLCDSKSRRSDAASPGLNQGQ